jgi:hypothetical protein
VFRFSSSWPLFAAPHQNFRKGQTRLAALLLNPIQHVMRFGAQQNSAALAAGAKRHCTPSQQIGTFAR